MKNMVSVSPSVACKFYVLPLLLGVLFGLMPQVASATLYGWSGATSTNWSDSSNWKGASVPSTGATNDVVIYITNTTHDLYYTAANGNSVLTNASGEASGRVLRLGDTGGSGKLYITGGTLQTIPTVGDLIGNAKTGILVVDGGIYCTTNTLLFGNANGTATLTINSGTAVVFKVQAGGAAGTENSTINLNGGLLAINQLTMSGTDVLTVNLASGTLQATGDISSWLTNGGAYYVTGPVALDTQAYNVTNAAVFGGTGSVTKIGAGTLTLSGANTYSGGTTISTGKLILIGSGSIANSANIAVAAGATCDVSAVTLTLGSAQTLKGTGTVIGNVTVSGTLAPGTDASTPGTLTNKGNVAFSSGGTNQVAINGSNYSKVDLGGTGGFNGDNAILALPASPPTGLASMLIVTNATSVSGQMIATNGTTLSENASLSSYPGWSGWYIHYRSSFGYVELNQSATPVVLLQLQALTLGGNVSVRWSTSSESKTAGFDLYRVVNGQSVKLNDSLIAAKGWPNGGVGASYSIADTGAQPGQTYTYKLVERTTDGQSIDYGPYDRTVTEFMMKPLEVTAAGAKVKWLSRAGESYRVLKSTALTSGQYQSIAENIVATPPENEYLDTTPGNSGFYRIELQP